MNLGESLRKLIKDNINITRPFFAYVIEQNADNTWVVQPIDDQPVVNNVQTFQTGIDGNDPIIGSLVLCIFIDDYNSFITEIVEYDTWYINSETSSVLGSNDINVTHGKRVYIDATKRTTEEIKTYIEQNPNLFGGNNSDGRFAAIESNGMVQISSAEYNNETNNVSFVRLNNTDVVSDGYGMILNNFTNLKSLITSKMGIELEGGNVNLKEILLDMLTLMGKINAAIATVTPTATGIGVPYPGITTDTASITTKLTTFTGN
jgi:hypothetical protein